MTAAEQAERAVAEIIGTFTSGAHRGVVVDSPPGAGKSTLVVRTSTELARQGEQICVVAQTNSQVDDLIIRMATAADDLRIGRLSAGDYRPSDEVSRFPFVRVASKIDDLASCKIIVGTAAKWVYVTDGQWPWAIIDEAYQMRSDMLLRIASRFERMLFVGDPGQLDPFSTVEESHRWAGLAWDPMQSAVAVLLRNNPDLPQLRLPLSWRLPPSAAPVVAKAFYPFTGFEAATAPQTRGMKATAAGLGVGPVDDVIDIAAETGWGFYEMPARNTIRTDAEAVQATVAIATRVLQRGTETYCEHAPGGRRIEPGRIAVGAAHRDQVTALRQALEASGGSGIRVDTANRLQGAEFDVTVMLHPLSGRIDATAFHLESGRLCVLTSRHRHACIVVGRAGIPDLLDTHPSVEPIYLDAMTKFPDGWEANQAMLAHLAGHRVAAF
ncbi:AAA domain-containing protein [Catelliglobosispora koreensis]|uniref:AAA domain-containing protein n=1 Tax=Catelliglobosispora koreensis TaxID=129052 RepID=UPI00036C5017|nr:AAA domain-containing protein [Catelliglobosispora koreensis]